MFGNGHLPDSQIAMENQLAGTHNARLKIGGIRRQELPACDVLAEEGDGSHVWKIMAKAFVMIAGSGEPHTVIDWTRGLVTQEEDDFFSDVNTRAAEHAASPG